MVAPGTVRPDIRRMILVVEGISASGKSSWCAAHGRGHIVPENGRLPGAPDRARDPRQAATFWAERNVDRWQAALAMEHRSALAVCDTDPLKLHYIWSLWKIGEATESEWLLELSATRETIVGGRIGFADLYLVSPIDPRVARQRALVDEGRRRRNFDLHVRLQPALMAWYTALEAALPGRVRFGLPNALPEAPGAADDRYDVPAFDRMIAALPA